MSREAPRVLVVDDETQMLSIVAFALETQGFEAVTARTAEQGWALLRREHFDLAVLDVTLPGASGVETCRRIRAQGDLPVLLLTARAREQDRIAGVLAGADDYLTKPFSPRELALRCQGLVRRAGRLHDERDLVNGDLRVDLVARRATLGGQLLSLSDVEYRLLVCLMRRAGRAVGWDELLNEVWETAEHSGGRDMIKTTVYRLRQRLGEGEQWVTAVRGTGYLMPQLDVPDDAREGRFPGV